MVLGKPRGMVRDYELTLYAYPMSSHVHRLLQAPRAGTPARPLRGCLTETAQAFHRARERRGPCWKRRDRPTLWIALTVIGYITLATMISQTAGMDTRMRTSTTVALAVLAAVGVAPLFWPRRNGRRFVERPRLDEWKPERET